MRSRIAARRKATVVPSSVYCPDTTRKLTGAGAQLLFGLGQHSARLVQGVFGAVQSHYTSGAPSESHSQAAVESAKTLARQQTCIGESIASCSYCSGDAQLQKHLLSRWADVRIALPGLARSLHDAFPDGHGELCHNDDGALCSPHPILDTWRLCGTSVKEAQIRTCRRAVAPPDSISYFKLDTSRSCGTSANAVRASTCDAPFYLPFVSRR